MPNARAAGTSSHIGQSGMGNNQQQLSNSIGEGRQNDNLNQNQNHNQNPYPRRTSFNNARADGQQLYREGIGLDAGLPSSAAIPGYQHAFDPASPSQRSSYLATANAERQQQNTVNQSQSQSSSIDSVTKFLAEMPTQREDPTRHVLWTELIKLKTRTLELQIAESRRKEREAELEIMRLKAGAAAKTDPQLDRTQHNMPHNSQVNPIRSNEPSGPSTSMNHNAYSIMSQHSHSQPLASTSQSQMQPTQNTFDGNQGPLTPFDLEAMLQSDNLDNLLSWLPDLGDGASQDLPSLAPDTDYPNNGNTSERPFSFYSNATAVSLPQFQQQQQAQTQERLSLSNASELPQSSPSKRRSPSPADSETPQQPPAKKAKRGTEKKIVLEQTASCLICSKLLARVMIRAPKSQIPEPVQTQLRCPICVPVDQPSAVPDQGASGSSSSGPIGTVDLRKRIRVSMEIDDEDAKVKDRRCWCDVCQRIVGSGQIVGGEEKESLLGMAEIVCAECDSKYQRCTDCGGGGGPRVGIGKWRMKQVFHPGRKTCSLSHTRLGDRTRELGVHVTPTDFTPEQMKEVLARCKALWNEKTLSRLAVPEMLEVDLPPGLSNPLRDYADVDDMVTRNWPSREAMIRADGLDPNRFKRLLSLIWSHSKPRRSVRTVDLEEEWSKQAEDADDDLSTVLANVKRTNVVIPPGSELIGMWGGEWDMQNGSLLISTFIPFEGADGEDSTALSVGEMITKVQALQQEVNAERTAQAEREGREPSLLPPCAHLWTVSGGYIPLVRERFADILIRKRSFVHVEEYLTRHPEFIESIKARPVGLHPDIVRSLPTSSTAGDAANGEGDGNGVGNQQQARPLILVRWLGKEWDHQKILEIKRMEFGQKKKRTKSKP
ncbi:hypothetical protein IAT40_000059 [Kwoniella sp. CBS 6097]